LKENGFNLNIPRYVDISESEEEIDIQATINDLKIFEKERQEVEIQVNKNLNGVE
jgi:type I restriction enzyme M protein